MSNARKSFNAVCPVTGHDVSISVEPPADNLREKNAVVYLRMVGTNGKLTYTFLTKADLTNLLKFLTTNTKKLKEPRPKWTAGFYVQSLYDSNDLLYIGPEITDVAVNSDRTVYSGSHGSWYADGKAWALVYVKADGSITRCAA